MTSGAQESVGRVSRVTGKEEFKRSWRFLVVGWLGLCFGKSGFENSYGAFIVPLMAARHWTMSAVSAWAIFEGLGAIISAPLIGLVMDRVGSRRVLLTALPLVALAYGSVSLVGHQIWMLYLAFFFVGFFGCAGLLAYGRAISGAFDVSRGTAFGLIYAGLATSSIFGPRLLQAIVDLRGWQTGFLALGGMLLIPVPLIFIWLKGAIVEKPSEELANIEGYTLKEAARTPTFWFLGWANIMYGLALGGVMFEMLPFLTANGLSRQSAALYVGLFGGCSFVGQLATGVTLDRVNAAFVCACLTVLDAVAIAFLGLSHAQILLWTVPLMGFTTGGYLTCYGYITPRWFGLRAFGAIAGAITTMQTIGWALSPYVFSIVKERAGSFDASFALATVMAVASAILFALVGRSGLYRRPRPVEPIPQPSSV